MADTRVAPKSAKAAGRPNFSGYWRQIKNENMDAFLQELGYPWVMRKAMMKYGSKSTDIIRTKGATMKIVTVNAKGAWTRVLDTEKPVHQRNAVGAFCKTSSFWDGSIHKSRLEPVDPSSGPSLESWRYMDGGMMVVRSSLRREKGREVVMFWYLESIKIPEKPHGLFERSGTAKISEDQKRVHRATKKDNAYLQYLGNNTTKWKTPADQYMSQRTERSSKAADGPVMSGSTSPLSMSSHALSPFSNSPRHSSGGAVHLPVSSTAGSIPRINSTGEVRHSAQASSDVEGAQQPQPHLEECKTDSSKTDKLDSAGSEGAKSSGLPPQRAQPYTHMRSFSGGSNQGGLYEFHAGSNGPGGYHGARRSLTNLSELGAEKSPESANRFRAPPESLEAQLSYKLQEYAENRSITSVVPVDNPLTTNEPELLQMSPEQAEDTQLKLSELERELRKTAANRHAYAEGTECCCCTTVFHSYTIPSGQWHCVKGLKTRIKGPLPVQLLLGGMDTRDAMHKEATTSGAFNPSTLESFEQIALVGAIFIAIDSLCSYTVINRWIRRWWKAMAAPDASQEELEKSISGISMRIVGMIHILIQVPLAIAVLLSPDLQQDRLYSKNPLSWRLVTTTAGYFVYDLYVHTVRYEFLPSLVHAGAALVVFLSGIYCGILHYYGGMFLMWECSTPFVFMRWGLHTLGRSNSKLYLYNGLTMMAVFFLCRNVMGVGMSWDFWRVSGAELAHPRPDGVPPAVLWVIRCMNLIFNFLNALWFSKMLKGAIKVLSKGKEVTPIEPTAEAQVALAQGHRKKHEE
ncbi:g5127 [Coccomyxa viridis]|uniref:G5127 protein n=1 Tax=Coccomyxa viridis TaxID=1274662 RepID=A0ABP1FS24_9CHLO